MKKINEIIAEKYLHPLTKLERKWIEEHFPNGEKDFTAASVLNALLDAINMDKWISVKDRLPEEGQWVLVYLSDGTQDVCQFKKIYEMEFVSNARCITERVYSWMPLPKPPKQ